MGAPARFDRRAIGMFGWSAVGGLFLVSVLSALMAVAVATD